MSNGIIEGTLNLERLQNVAATIRRDVIEMIYLGGSGHPGGCLSAVEILTSLYFKYMRIHPENPHWSDRDRFVLSKGHAAPLVYAVLAERGFYPRSWLKTFQQDGTRLQKHLDMHLVPGAEVSTGSLGQGLSVASGMALAFRIDQKPGRVYVLIGDGECQEGQIWETALSAAQLQLDNLIVFLDLNKLQVDGRVDEINSLEPVVEKWRSFRWDVQEINGHDFVEIHKAIDRALVTSGAPHMIVAHTVKGKGVSFMEDQFEWHSKALNEGQYQQAMAELGAEKAGSGGQMDE
ncbi:MAG: transketolase [Anaerolineales bacterium]|nr:transketolase [Anaerolineales bacterium]